MDKQPGACTTGKLEGDNHAKIRDFGHGSDGVCGVDGICSGQRYGQLWAEQGGQSVLHACSPVIARSRLWHMGGMRAAGERRGRATSQETS